MHLSSSSWDMMLVGRTWCMSRNLCTVVCANRDFWASRGSLTSLDSTRNFRLEPACSLVSAENWSVATEHSVVWRFFSNDCCEIQVNCISCEEGRSLKAHLLIDKFLNCFQTCLYVLSSCPPQWQAFCWVARWVVWWTGDWTKMSSSSSLSEFSLSSLSWSKFKDYFASSVFLVLVLLL